MKKSVKIMGALVIMMTLLIALTTISNAGGIDAAGLAGQLTGSTSGAQQDVMNIGNQIIGIITTVGVVVAVVILLVLGIKYMIERSGRVEENPYFTDLHSYGDVHLLENNVYLPLGFLANSTLAQVDFASRSSDIDFQNELFTAATGIQDRVWKFIYGDCLTITAADATLNNWENGGVCNYTTADSSGSVNYRYVFGEEGFLCVSLDLPNRNNFTFYLNGNELYSDSYSIPQSAAVCQVKPGDVIDISLSDDSAFTLYHISRSFFADSSIHACLFRSLLLRFVSVP